MVPSRQAGLPTTGWDTTGYNGHVPAGKQMTTGHMCPSDDNPTPSANKIVSVEAYAEETMDSYSQPDASITSSTKTVIRTLGCARPPIDAVPDSTPTPTTTPTPTPTPTSTSTSQNDTEKITTTDTDSDTTSTISESIEKQTLLLPCVDVWLADIESRLIQSLDIDASVADGNRQPGSNQPDAGHSPYASSESRQRSIDTDYQALQDITERIDQITIATSYTLDQPIRILRQIATHTVNTSSFASAFDVQSMEASVAGDRKMRYNSTNMVIQPVTQKMSICWCLLWLRKFLPCGMDNDKIVLTLIGRHMLIVFMIQD